MGCVKVFSVCPYSLFCALNLPKNPDAVAEVSGQATVGNHDRAWFWQVTSPLQHAALQGADRPLTLVGSQRMSSQDT